MMQGLRTVVFPVRDLDESKAFYEALLGCAPYFDEPFYVGFSVDGYELGLLPDEDACSTNGARAYWGVADLETTLHRAVELGATVLSSPEDVGGGIRLASVVDPSGNRLGLIHNPAFRAEVGAQSAAAVEPLASPIVRTAQVAWPVASVWKLWTVSEGMQSWLTLANIELRMGGPFELLFDHSQPPGRQGSEGCRVLSFIPNRMLSFTWNAPPHLSTRGQRTWVVLELADHGSSTAVTLTHTGWPEGALATGDWPATYAYFERAWSGVLHALTRHCSEVEPLG
ncbi:MAG: SRPBCC domain-containing protein [Proteobacteria bacterium]|nr:SRPBCC domain-containing protein [Pseudomonadota bacterium]